MIDLTQGQVLQTISLAAAPPGDADETPIASVCSVQHVLYAAVGSEVRRVDLREPSQGVTLFSCQDEVNQVRGALRSVQDTASGEPALYSDRGAGRRACERSPLRGLVLRVAGVLEQQGRVPRYRGRYRHSAGAL